MGNFSDNLRFLFWNHFAAASLKRKLGNKEPLVLSVSTTSEEAPAGFRKEPGVIQEAIIDLFIRKDFETRGVTYLKNGSF